ncbi:hypothetical protein VNI00_011399 [Paramarasmius palmivorus]|uniref:Uncharacterized protein n=1 Tax=Paramarasmius palmivorus TaxID=297713 RepID=A0AAW0CC62_9AGAR
MMSNGISAHLHHIFVHGFWADPKNLSSYSYPHKQEPEFLQGTAYLAGYASASTPLTQPSPNQDILVPSETGVVQGKVWLCQHWPEFDGYDINALPYDDRKFQLVQVTFDSGITPPREVFAYVWDEAVLKKQPKPERESIMAMQFRVLHRELHDITPEQYKPEKVFIPTLPSEDLKQRIFGDSDEGVENPRQVHTYGYAPDYRNGRWGLNWISRSESTPVDWVVTEGTVWTITGHAQWCAYENYIGKFRRTDIEIDLVLVCDTDETYMENVHSIVWCT